jgi:DNA-binding NtrC family response regulator
MKHDVQHPGILRRPGRESSKLAHCLSAARATAFGHRSSSPVNPAPLKSIVLVDDEKSYNDLIRQMLAENLDLPVHGFTRPLEALDALAQLDPGVVVTDYFMPEMNGIEFIQRASPLVPHAVFVMISGNNLAGEQHRMEKLAALKSFLAKPFGWKKLADEILRVWPPEFQAPFNRADSAAR